MPRGIPNSVLAEPVDTSGMVGQAPASGDHVKTIPMRLDRNYRPSGYFEVAGHYQPEIKRKNPAGQDVVIQAAAFIPGDPMPPAIGGTGYSNKFWTGTVLKVGEAEAKTMRRAGIGSVDLLD